MPEQREQVKTIHVDYICDECGKGKMEFVAGTIDCWEHQCEICDHKQILEEQYPKVEYI